MDRGTTANRQSKSHLFKLQTDELLNSLKVDYDGLVIRIKGLLSDLKDVILCIPERSPQHSIEAEKVIKQEYGIAVPFPHPRPATSTKYLVSFQPPTDVNVVGSFGLRCGSRSSEPLMIDLAITMPETLFQEKDYLDYRYFHKRAFYISYVAARIKEVKGDHFQMKFDLQDGDSLRPVILLEPNFSYYPDLSHFKPVIRIIVAINGKIIPASKTHPMKSNIRLASSGNEPFGDFIAKPSTFYNSAFRSDASVTQYHKFIYQSMQKYDSLRDAGLLGRNWLRKRGFHGEIHRGGFGGFEWTALLALLYEGGGHHSQPLLLPSYNSYQVFKIVLQFLSKRNLMQPLVFGPSDLSFPPNSPVLFDGKRGMNLLYKMTPSSYRLLQHEATLSLAMLNELRFNYFDKVFLDHTDDPLLRFDRILVVNFPAPLIGTLQFLNYQSSFYRILETALGDRVRLIHLSSKNSNPWPLNSRVLHRPLESDMTVGLLLEPENVNRPIDFGPSAENKEASRTFQEFWGEKAEIRKFRDGRVCESLVWSDEQSAPSILRQICIYILQRHLNIPEQNVQDIGEQYDQTAISLGHPYNPSRNAYQPLLDAYNSLQKSLHMLGEVPLAIRQLLPASPFLRHACPKDTSEAFNGIPISVVLQLESSIKWPDDLTAVQLTKAAFLSKIGDLLESNQEITSFRLGLENESEDLFNKAFLDVLHPSGIIFRLRIYHDREQTLLERRLENRDLSSHLKEQTAIALSEYKQLFIHGPRLTQAIQRLCNRFPLLTPTIFLMKKWFRSHLLYSEIKEEVIELITIHTFVRPQPWEAPASVLSGFLRTLYFITKWDWQHSPLVLEFGNLTIKELANIRTHFEAWRKIDPAFSKVSLVIPSEVDETGVVWTINEKPPKVIAARMSSLAKAAIAVVKQDMHVPVDRVCKTSLARYDFLIHLNVSMKLRSGRSSDSFRFKNLGLPSQNTSTCPDLAILLCQELQATFSSSVQFFFGGAGSHTIAGLWKPQARERKGWSLKLPYPIYPVQTTESTTENEVMINKVSILNQIARLGGNLIDKIDMHT